MIRTRGPIVPAGRFEVEASKAERMRRIIALDIGAVRIGVAVSDPLGTFAQGIAVLSAAGEWMEELNGIAEELDAGTLLVGMPRRTDGTEGPEALEMRTIIDDLSRRFPGMEVTPWDERYTTAIATQALIEADVSRKGRKGRVDKVAATLLLQSYLDSLRDEPGAPTDPISPADRIPKERGRNRRRGKSNYVL
jgi:putative Holliday junction resolvase